MNIMQMRRGMGARGALYDAEVEYIDVSGKYLITDIDSTSVSAFDFSFSFDGTKSSFILGGGNFAVAHAGGGIMEARVTTQGTGVNTSTYALAANRRLRVYCNGAMTSVVFTGATGRSVAYTHPVSTTAGKVAAFYKEGGSYNLHGIYIYSLFLYDNTGNIIFQGIPVRKGEEGALYDTINNRMYFWDGIGSYIPGPDVQ